MSNVKEETVPRTEATSPVTTATAPAKSPRGRLLVILFGIGMLVLGLIGGWLLASDADETATWGGEVDGTTLADIDELLDDYWAAWDAGDGEAVVAQMTTDGWFSSPYTAEDGYAGVLLVSYVNSYDEVEFTQVGPTTVVETPAGYEVAGAARSYDPYNDETKWPLDHYVIVEEDGQLLIASHQVISTF